MQSSFLGGKYPNRADIKRFLETLGRLKGAGQDELTADRLAETAALRVPGAA